MQRVSEQSGILAQLTFAVALCLGMNPALCGAAEDPRPWGAVQLDIIPAPKQCRASGRESLVRRDARIAIVAPSDAAPVRTAAQLVASVFGRQGFRDVKIVQADPGGAELTIVLCVGGGAGLADGGAARHPASKPPAPPPPQGYFLRISILPGPIGARGASLGGEKQPDGEEQVPARSSAGRPRPVEHVLAVIVGGSDAGTLYGAYTLLKVLRFTAEGVVVRELQIDDAPAMAVRGLSPQWAWYIGQNAPYGAALWHLDRWKTALDFMAEYRINMLALCTYGKFPFLLERHQARCAVDLRFELWNPREGYHTIRWTHPAYADDFFAELVRYAHARGIRVLIYSCLNLQDEVGSRQWTNEAEIQSYTDIQAQVLKRYGIDGFVFESGEYYLTHPEDQARFGTDQWSRLRADVFLTRRYVEAICAVKPDATIGLVDHYLFMDWDQHRVPQRSGLTRWKAELPPQTLVAYVHAPETYDVFPPDRIWTYVFGPKGGLKPALQIHLADCCDVPRAKRAAGAYYVTYDWAPHEPDYLCFAESAWGNYGGREAPLFAVHSSEPGVGGPISKRLWTNIKREMYGEGSRFGDGLLAASRGTCPDAWSPEADLHRTLFEEVVPPLDAGDFDAAARIVARVERQRRDTAEGLAEMRAARRQATPAMVTAYSLAEHLDKAILLTQVQSAWLDFLHQYYQTAVAIDRHPDRTGDCRGAIAALRRAARASHARIRDSLWQAYFSYPHDTLGKYEFLGADGGYLEDIEKLATRLVMETDAEGKRLRLENASLAARASADSNFRAGYYDPAFAIDGKEGNAGRDIWVSAETQPPHFLEVRLKQAARVRGIIVNWVRGSSVDWVPREFAIRLQTAGQWRPVLTRKGNREAITAIKLDEPILADTVRIEITAGSASRPRLAAINEVQVLTITATK